MDSAVYLIDRDGVFLQAKGGAPVAGALSWVETLVRKDVPFLIASNHTTSSPHESAQKLRDRGFPVEDHHMHTPLSILAQEPGEGRRVYARGSPGFLAYLTSLGWEVRDDDAVDRVILGFDREMSTAALAVAIEAMVRHQASLVALHVNRLFQDTAGRLEPGLGAWVRALEYATGERARVIGKPSPDYYRAALTKLGVSPGRAVMISDDPLGDLVGAQEVGIRTIFVTSGIYGPEAVERLGELQRPGEILPSIASVPIFAINHT